jgi:hypothetical protein
MSDMIIKLSGDSHRVERPYDGKIVNFIAREMAFVERVDEAAQTTKLIEVIRPGMFVYCLSDALRDATYDQCRQRLELLPVFYVLELLEKVAVADANADAGGVGDDVGVGNLRSDDAEALVLECKLFRDISGVVLKSRTMVNPTDLIMSSQPCRVPIDSIVTRMRAEIGPGSRLIVIAPTLPRRVSHFADVDDQFRFNDGGQIRPLTSDHNILLSPNSDNARFLIVGQEGAPHVPLKRSAEHLKTKVSRRRTYVPSGRPRGRPRKSAKRHVDDDGDDVDEYVDNNNKSIINNNKNNTNTTNTNSTNTTTDEEHFSDNGGIDGLADAALLARHAESAAVSSSPPPLARIRSSAASTTTTGRAVVTSVPHALPARAPQADKFICTPPVNAVD